MQISQWSQRLIRIELLWLAALAPFLFFPTPERALALLGLPLLWGVRWLAQRHFVPRTPLDGSLLLLLIMVGVSLWATFDPLFSLPKVTGVLLGVATFYGLVALGQTAGGVWLAGLALLLAGCGIAGGSLIGTQWTNKVAALAGITDRLPVLLQGLPGSPLDGFNPNGVAGALLFVVPLALALAMSSLRGWLPGRSWLSKGSWPLFFWPLLLFLAGTLILTQSRGGYIGLAVGVLTLLFLALPRLTLALAAVGIVLVAGAWFVEPGIVASARGQVAGLVEQGAGSIEGRAALWVRAYFGLLDFPFTGMGMGMFRRVVPLLYPMYTIAPEPDIGHAHNHLLAAGVDLGAPGLVAYLSLWLGAGVMVWQVWRTATVPFMRALCIGLAAGLAAHFAWGMTDSNVLGSKAGILFWLSLGALGALHRNVMVIGKTR